jgi:hypothetical protein
MRRFATCLRTLVGVGSLTILGSATHSLAAPNVFIVECAKAGPVYNVTAAPDSGLVSRECGDVLAQVVANGYHIAFVTPLPDGSVVYTLIRR